MLTAPKLEGIDPTPWTAAAFSGTEIHDADGFLIAKFFHRLGEQYAKRNAAGALYAVNTIDTAIAERDAAIARVGELEARVAELEADWTDEQCVRFMCTALRHVQYEGDTSPDTRDIRMGQRMALRGTLAAPPVALSAAKVGGAG